MTTPDAPSSAAYEVPALRVIGTVHNLTQQALDKIGDSADFLTALLPNLDGVIQPDSGGG